MHRRDRFHFHDWRSQTAFIDWSKVHVRISAYDKRGRTFALQLRKDIKVPHCVVQALEDWASGNLATQQLARAQVRDFCTRLESDILNDTKSIKVVHDRQLTKFLERIRPVCDSDDTWWNFCRISFSASSYDRSSTSSIGIEGERQDFSECLFGKQDFPRFWELLRFIFGHRLREQVFEPAYNDLLADHLTTRAARFQIPWARRWIVFCFGTRTVWLVVECAAVGLKGAAATVLIPRWLREWLGRWG